MNKCKASKVREDDLMCFSYWGRVKDSRARELPTGHTVDVANVDDGQEFTVHGTALIERSASADQFNDEVLVTQTELAEKLVSSWNTPFTVVFTKKDGSVRTLRGRLINHEHLMGRSRVEDLDIATGSRFRLVDHRNLISLVVGNVKYVLKA